MFYLFVILDLDWVVRELCIIGQHSFCFFKALAEYLHWFVNRLEQYWEICKLIRFENHISFLIVDKKVVTWFCEIKDVKIFFIQNRNVFLIQSWFTLFTHKIVYFELCLKLFQIIDIFFLQFDSILSFPSLRFYVT